MNRGDCTEDDRCIRQITEDRGESRRLHQDEGEFQEDAEARCSRDGRSLRIIPTPRIQEPEFYPSPRNNMYTPDTKILKRYADVLVRFALWS